MNGSEHPRPHADPAPASPQGQPTATAAAASGAAPTGPPPAADTDKVKVDISEPATKMELAELRLLVEALSDELVRLRQQVISHGVRLVGHSERLNLVETK